MGFIGKKTLYRQALYLLIGIIGVLCTPIPPSDAAETVTIQFGPFTQTVKISEIEQYAKTGRLSNSLQVFAPFLTPDVRNLLNQKVDIDPQVADRFIGEILNTPQGQQIFARLGQAIPGSNRDTIQGALNLMIRQVNGASILGFLRAYPGRNVTVDASKLLEVGLALNPDNLKSQALGVFLERDLATTERTSLPGNINPSNPGKYPVQVQTINFNRGNRQIIADIYIGDTQSQQPLVVLSHGFGANRLFLKYLGEHLASHGITTVSIEHPGSNSRAVNQAINRTNLARLISASEFIDRPQDITSLLDELSRRNQQNPTGVKFNTNNTVVIGHSLGGYTALALAGGELNIGELRRYCQRNLNAAASPGDWLQCAGASLPEKPIPLRDQRIQRAIALNPLVGQLFGRQGLSQINIPVLMVASTEDAITPAVSHQIKPFSQLRGSKYLITAIGGTHLSLSDSNYQIPGTTLVRERRGREADRFRQLIRGVGLAFVKELTPEASIYRPFLSSSYTQSFSTTAIPLRFGSDLPKSVQSWLEVSRE